MGKQLIVTKTQKRILQKIVKRRSNKAHLVERGTIILVYKRTRNKQAVVRECGKSLDKVTRWVDRWDSFEKKLKEYEKTYQAGTLEQKVYEKEILILLNDEQRIGAPPKFTESQRQQIIALAAQKPEDADVPITHWSHEILAQTAVDKGIVTSISSTHIGTFLKYGGTTTTQE